MFQNFYISIHLTSKVCKEFHQELSTWQYIIICIPSRTHERSLETSLKNHNVTSHVKCLSNSLCFVGPHNPCIVFCDVLSFQCCHYLILIIWDSSIQQICRNKSKCRYKTETYLGYLLQVMGGDSGRWWYDLTKDQSENFMMTEPPMMYLEIMGAVHSKIILSPE